MFKRILLAYDGSEHAQHAAEYAKELALRFKSELLIVYAFNPIPRWWGDPLVENAMQRETKHAGEVIQKAFAFFQGTNIHLDSQIIEGPAAEAILRAAEGQMIDAIVIGSRGLGQATGLLLGSVSDKVMHNAPCTVVVVK